MFYLSNSITGAVRTSLFYCGITSLSVRKYSVSSKLPNEVAMAEKLMPLMTDTRYDLVSGDWFEYDISLGLWKRLTVFEIDQKIFKLLRSDDDLKGLLTADYKNRVKISLEMINGLNFNIYRTKNQDLQLIPFKNGVLDLFKQELMPHDPNNYFSYGLNINYDPSAKLSPEMVAFLRNLANGNLVNLRVLRSFIKCILLRDNQYQVALYLYGPGGTGKSTFEKLLISLVGNNNSTTLDLNDLNKQFSIQFTYKSTPLTPLPPYMSLYWG